MDSPNSSGATSRFSVGPNTMGINAAIQGDDTQREDSPMPDAPSIPGLTISRSNEATAFSPAARNMHPRGTFIDETAMMAAQSESVAQPIESNTYYHGAPSDTLMSDFSDPDADRDSSYSPAHHLADSTTNMEAQSRFWEPIYEDQSVAGIDEIKRLETAGESSAEDNAHWESIAFKDLEDPDYEPYASGTIEWQIPKLFGTHASPSSELILRSPSVNIGNEIFNLLVYPRGNGTDYLAAYVECTSLCTSESKDSNSAPDDGLVDCPLPVLSNVGLPKSKRICAQVLIIMYNPQEPRVHFHKTTNHGFVATQPDHGFIRFGTIPFYDLGLRLPETRKPMVQNNTLAFKAYIRLIRDPTGFLFMDEKPGNREKFALTGLRSVAPFEDAKGMTHSLSAAIIIFILFSPVRWAIYQVPDLEGRPLIKALINFLGHIRDGGERRPSSTTSWNPIVPMDIAMALDWFGDIASLCTISRFLRDVEQANQENFAPSRKAHPRYKPVWHPEGKGLEELDVVQVLEYLFRTCLNEVSGTELESTFSALFPPSGWRVLLQDSMFRVDQQLSLYFQNYSFTQLPRVIVAEFARQNFDSSKQEWSKSDRAVVLDEQITLIHAEEAQEYYLYGFIEHHGSLDSRTYTSTVRPNGKSWYRFATSLNPRVTRLTKKQALLDPQRNIHIAIFVKWDLAMSDIIVDSPSFRGYPETAGLGILSKISDDSRGRSKHFDNPTASGDPRTPILSSGSEQTSTSDLNHLHSSAHGSGQIVPPKKEDKIIPQSTEAAPACPQNHEPTPEICHAEPNVLGKSETPTQVTEQSIPDSNTASKPFKYNFLGQDYYHGTFRAGLRHGGKGHLISLGGDSYRGPFADGKRHGAYGMQTFANGDEYKGSWENDQMHGKGTYKTAATGTTYVGGFREGKRHGAFKLEGDHAESLSDCLICWGAQREAVFYPCGHVVACLACGQLVKTCPFCKRSISDCIKVYWT